MEESASLGFVKEGAADGGEPEMLVGDAPWGDAVGSSGGFVAIPVVVVVEEEGIRRRERRSWSGGRMSRREGGIGGLLLVGDGEMGGREGVGGDVAVGMI